MGNVSGCFRPVKENRLTYKANGGSAKSRGKSGVLAFTSANPHHRINGSAPDIGCRKTTPVHNGGIKILSKSCNDCLLKNDEKRSMLNKLFMRPQSESKYSEAEKFIDNLFAKNKNFDDVTDSIDATLNKPIRGSEFFFMYRLNLELTKGLISLLLNTLEEIKKGVNIKEDEAVGRNIFRESKLYNLELFVSSNNEPMTDEDKSYKANQISKTFYHLTERLFEKISEKIYEKDCEEYSCLEYKKLLQGILISTNCLYNEYSNIDEKITAIKEAQEKLLPLFAILENMQKVPDIPLNG